MDHYLHLQQILDVHPSGAPPSVNLTRILQILFTPEEAALACHLTFLPQPLSKIAAKSGSDPAYLQTLLDIMASKVIIIAKSKPGQETSYALLPTIPGLFEFPFMQPKPAFDVKELGHLWHEYHTEALGLAYGSSETPHTRVVPVQTTIPMTSEILPYEDVAQLIDDAGYIALAPCACRTSVGACDKPREVCFVFGSTGRFLVERGLARTVDKDEAKKILVMAEEQGLVHCTNNTQKDRLVICNCCSCCCTLLRGINVLHNPRAIAKSAYTIAFNDAECISCGACLDDRCQVHAITENDDKILVDSNHCIGCGLCVSVCPTDALHLQLRADAPSVPVNGQELMGALLVQKGKLEAFTKLHQG
ncbi:MAG: 4Fe-4S binding protein [Methylocystaceae bacterium]